MKRKSEAPSAILGARASTAGDFFHELWALRAALGLIAPHSDLRAVTVEGVAAPKASAHAYDGVDCALFYGGTSLETASRIEILQLKYSTAQPDASWTVSRLITPKSKGGNNSVIHKLAKEFSNARSQTVPGAKLVIKLVSNQPLASEVTDTIASIRTGDYKTANASKLVKAAGLSLAELLEFLEALDFSDMGAKSRSALQDSIAIDISQMVGECADPLLLQMLSRIRMLMLPGAEREVVTRVTVLSWFGISSLSALFPAPADLQPMAKAIPRNPAQEICAALISGEQLVCLHGLGGCGKTTTLRQIQGMLPAGSVSVLFDCYGAGRYSHSDDRRHRSENAFLQIINDMATQQGVPFLLAKQGSNLVNIHTFFERIKSSADRLSSVSPHGLLTIIIDAADNSVAAAQWDSNPSECFVWELARADLQQLPPNVRLVLSSRTGRRDTLQLPSNAKIIECPPFTALETRAHATMRLLDASEEWLDQFHALSRGIPRVQAYAFKKGGGSPADILNALRPSGKGLDSVLQELFKEAAKKGGVDFYERCTAAISVLPRPVPLCHLAALCDTDVAVVQDFVSDVSPTLRIEDAGTVTIADEDVEDFLEVEALQAQEKTLAKACDHFESLYRTDAYAATHYCTLLTKSGRADKILPIIEADMMPAGISDPIVRREVQVRRLRLALAACRKANSPADILKVMVLSAEASKDEFALRELLEQEPQLSVRFASGSLLRLIFSDRDTYPRQGSILVQAALSSAMQGDKVSANEQLHLYQSWLQRRRDTEHPHEWKRPLSDLAAFAQTLVMLDGAERFWTRLQAWSPLSFRVSIGLEIIPRLIKIGRSDIVEHAYRERLVPSPWNLLLAVPLAQSGVEIHRDRLASDLSALKLRHVPDPSQYHSQGEGAWELKLLEAIVTGCEIGYAIGVSPNTLKRVLNLVLHQKAASSRRLHHTDVPNIDVMLRSWLLYRLLNGNVPVGDLAEWVKEQRPICIEDFCKFADDGQDRVEKDVKKTTKKSSQSVQREVNSDLKRVIGGIAHIYVARLGVLIQAASSSIQNRPSTDLMLSIDSYDFARDYYGNQFRVQAGCSLARLMHLKGLSCEYLYDCAVCALSSRQSGPFAEQYLPVWQEFLANKNLQQKVMDEIASLAKATVLERTSAREKISALLSFSKVVLDFSPNDARALFETAVAVTQEIDREALLQVEFVASLTERQEVLEDAAKRELAVAHAAYITDVAVRLQGEDYFPWSKAIFAVHDLSPEVALSASCQWQDEGLATLDETLAPLLTRIVTEDGRQALACSLFYLLDQVPERSFKRFIDSIRETDDLTLRDAFNIVSKKVLMDIAPSQRAAILKTLATKLSEFGDVGDMSSRVQAEAAANSAGIVERDRGVVVQPVAAVLADDADLSTESGMEAAIEVLVSTKSKGGSYVSLQNVLEVIRGRVANPAQRIMFLNVVSAFGERGLDVEDRIRVILDTLAIWGGPGIDRWKAEELPKIIKSNLWSMTRWLHESDAFPQLVRAANFEGSALIDVIAHGVAERSEDYSARSLFGLCGVAASGLPNADAKAVLSWYIARLAAKVPKDVVARFSLSEVSSSFESAVGRFLFAQFSDIDLRIRWRAAHGLRVLVTLDGEWAISSLLAVFDRKNDDAFRLRDAPYYWLGARLFSVMTIARIALESPKAVVSSAGKLFEIATDNALPHYLIRSYARDALECLLAHSSTVLSATERKLLAAVNRAKLKPKSRKKGEYRALERAKRKSERFNFDSLDTIPYWYEGLYGHFASLTPNNFFSTLER